ncbi:MAG: leucine-rich repeat domain-containing protein [Spirochaetaceae bacterium]|nr:leucine-rich repeat domain-containing protein [Spirochaetaceae bacterium]
MKKILIPIMLLFSFILFSCGGGGGGAAGASIPDSEYTTHNPHGWGGGSGSGSGSGGNGGSNNGTIMGGTPLTVTGYTYNGQTYTSVEELRNAIAENAPEGQFTIPFTCTVAGGGSETRTARITKTVSGNDTEILIEHQYKATFPDGAGTQEVSYYMNDGIVLPGDPAGTNINDFIFETNWNIGGTLYPCGSSISVASSGDMDFSNATTEMAKYGFKDAGGGEYILGFTDESFNGTITVNTNRTIKQIKLPENGSVNLDLSNAHFKDNRVGTSYFWDGNGAAVTGMILPNTVTSIENSAFYGSNIFANLNSITIPNSVTTIGDYAFKGRQNLQTVNIQGNSLTSIGEQAFSGCSALQSFTMPNSVTSMGTNAFNGCENLGSVTLSNNLQSIPNQAFYNCGNLGTDLNIPASVTEIGSSAFWHCTGIQNLTLNNGLQTIDGNAFEGCTGIGSVSIPNTVTTIGDGVFISCSNLAQISIPPSVSSIGNYAFNGVETDCVLTINSNGGNISLGTLALPNSNFSVHLTGTGFPMQNAATSIFDANPNLTSVEIESGISTIPNYAFISCSNLKNVELPSGITTIKNNAFDNCTKLETINIPATVTQIKDEAFKNAGQNAAHTLTLTFKGHQNNMTECNLPNKTFDVVLEGGVPTKNGVSIFNNAQTLQSVVFKGGQLDVDMAFSGCDSLTTVTFNSYPTGIGTNIFPDDVAGIIFDPYPNEMTNVKNISNLLTPGRIFLTNPLAVTFKNNTTRKITINANAFNFSGAENIEYIFEADPNNEKMSYDNGNCFKSGTRIEYGGSYYDWDPTSKSWVQE